MRLNHPVRPTTPMVSVVSDPVAWYFYTFFDTLQEREPARSVRGCAQGDRLSGSDLQKYQYLRTAIYLPRDGREDLRRRRAMASGQQSKRML